MGARRGGGDDGPARLGRVLARCSVVFQFPVMYRVFSMFFYGFPVVFNEFSVIF